MDTNKYNETAGKPWNCFPDLPVREWLESEFNPDCFLDSADLIPIAARLRDERLAVDGEFGQGVALLLETYCVHKSGAMAYRLAGIMTTACWHESICDQIYRKLPESIRW